MKRIRSSKLASLAQRLRPAGLVRLPEAALPGAARGLFWQFLPFGSIQIISRNSDGIWRFLLTWRRGGNTAAR